MIASIRTTMHFWLRGLLYGTRPGSVARRLRKSVRRSEAVHERPEYWNEQIRRLYRRPNVNGRVSSGLRHTTTALLLKTCGLEPTAALDVGCAYGDLAESLVAIGLRRYVGVDLSDEGIEAARREAHLRPAAERCRMEFHRADLRDFEPDDDDRFDAIIFNEVLKYLDVDEAVRQVRRYARWLAPGGAFCVNLTDDPKCHAIYQRLAARFQWVYGTLYQQRPDGPCFRVTRDRANPGYLVGLFRPQRAEAERGNQTAHEHLR